MAVFTDNNEGLKKWIDDWNVEEKGEILFNTAVNYLESKYKDELHKKTGESLVSITLREPSFWAWYLRIVNITEKEFIEVCARKQVRGVMMEQYRISIEKILSTYNIANTVTYSKFNASQKKSLTHK